MSGLLATVNPRRIKAAHRRRRKVASGQSVQRYYDPHVGRFLSVDPVTADPNTGANFNRYKYASNNPYRFTDPDGRMDKETRRELMRDRSSILAKSPGSAAQMATSARSSGGGNAGSRSETLGNVAQAARVLTGALDSSLGAASETAPKKVGDFVGTGIIKKWEGASKAEVDTARAVGKLSQGVGLVSMGISAWDFKTARDAGDTPGMVAAGTGFGFGAVGLTPWGAPGAVAFGATSLVMDTPLGKGFTGKMVDGMCSASGDC